MDRFGGFRAIERRAVESHEDASRRWDATDAGPLDEAIAAFASAGRLTVNFHPDRIGRNGHSAASGIAADGSYLSQWMTGTSGGSRSAIEGGLREKFENEFFGRCHRNRGLPPIYGSLDLFDDPHGGSPRFGSCFLILEDHVRERSTLSLGDSHIQPSDVGSFRSPSSLLAGLAERSAAGTLFGRPLGGRTLRDVLEGRGRSSEPARELDRYVEIQIHGGVDLESDAHAIVFDPSFAGTEVEASLAEAADRYQCGLSSHAGSEMRAVETPVDHRGTGMRDLAERIARRGGVVDARCIGLAAAKEPFAPPQATGDPDSSQLQQLKYLWHTLLAFGHDAVAR